MIDDLLFPIFEDPHFDSIDETDEADSTDSAEDEEKEVREDKIFNNRYNTGEGLEETEEYQYQKNISVSVDYSDAYLRDLYDYENELDLRVILDLIFKQFKEDEEINNIFEISKLNFNLKKIKISKSDLNFVFNKLHEKIKKNSSGIIFYSPIYVLEVISSVSSMDYKKLFDMLNTENQEILLIELNEKYLFLEGKMTKKRIH